MTQNTYAQPPGPPGFDPAAPMVTRTSVTAILSLVCALVCFVPGLGILAIVLGIASLFLISSAQGRVSGKGLAFSGIFIGLLATLVWGGIGYGITWASKMFGKQFMGPSSSFFQSVEAKDYSQARTLLNTPAGSPAPTDEQLDAFLAAYTGEVGTFQSMPKGLFEFIGTVFSGKMQDFDFKHQSNEPIIPIPTEFTNGTALVILEMPPGFQPGNTPNPKGVGIVNVAVHTKGGSTIWLIPKPASSTTPVPAPAPSSPPGTPGASGSSPADPQPPPSGNGG